jgi:hypothetical protein
MGNISATSIISTLQEIKLKIRAKLVELFHQKWRYYLHCCTSISTTRPRIYAQISNGGGSGDGGDIFRLYLGSIVMEKS